MTVKDGNGRTFTLHRFTPRTTDRLDAEIRRQYPDLSDVFVHWLIKLIELSAQEARRRQAERNIGQSGVTIDTDERPAG